MFQKQILVTAWPGRPVPTKGPQKAAEEVPVDGVSRISACSLLQGVMLQQTQLSDCTMP